MPSPCTKKGVVEAIFRAMQHDVPRDWNSAHIIEEIANLVQKHHTLMIMLDEADRIFGVDTDAVGASASKACGQPGCTCSSVGTPAAESLAA